VKLGIISDIHCNVSALKEALEDMGQVDAILCAGDAVYQYRFCNDVFDVIRQRGIFTVLGNHESVILSPQGERVRTSGQISAENFDFLESLPINLEMNVDGMRIFMTHGSPWEPHKEYLFPGSHKFRRLPELGADVIILGHTHYPMVTTEKGVLVVNPGSCGEPREYSRLGHTYAILDTKSGEVVIKSLKGEWR